MESEVEPLTPQASVDEPPEEMLAGDAVNDEMTGASLPPAPVVEPKHPARTPMMTRAEKDWTVFISDSLSRKSGDFRPPFTQRALHLVLPRTRTRPS